MLKPVPNAVTFNKHWRRDQKRNASVHYAKVYRYDVSPKREKPKKEPKGSSLKTYYEEATPSWTNWTRSCNSSGCTTSNSAVFTITKLRRLDVETTRNNKKARPWSDLRYSYQRHFGGQIHSAENSAWEDWNSGYQVIHPYQSKSSYQNHPFARQGFYENSNLRTDAKNICLMKLLSSLKESRTQYNLAVALGEAKETASMLAHTAGRLVSSYRSFRKGKITDAWRQLRGKNQVPVHHQESFRLLKKRAKRDSWVDEAQSAWMEFNFGWKPLLGDIDSAAKYLAEKHVRGYFPVQEISHAHRLRNFNSIRYENGYAPTKRARVWQSCHARITYEVSPNWARKPDTLDELGFKDPATVAWELAPVSWLVDYFVNVGQVLESLHEFQQWSVVRGLSSHRSTTQQEMSMVRNFITPNGWKYSPGTLVHPEQYMKAMWCRRETLTSLPTSIPLTIKVSNPFDLHTGQLASAIIMMRYAFST